MEKLKKYLPLVAVILAVVAVAMMFLPAFEGEANKDIKGFNAVFGYSMMGMKVLDFSFMNLVPYVLLIVGIVCAGMVSKKEDNFVISIVAAVCMLVAGIFFFMVPNFSVSAIPGISVNAKIGTGAILSAVCSIAGAVCVAIPAVLKKLGK